MTDPRQPDTCRPVGSPHVWTRTSKTVTTGDGYTTRRVSWHVCHFCGATKGRHAHHGEMN